MVSTCFKFLVHAHTPSGLCGYHFYFLLFHTYTYLNEDEVSLDQFLDGGVAPQVPVEDLAREFPGVLEVDQQPALPVATSLLGLTRNKRGNEKKQRRDRQKDASDQVCGEDLII